MVFFRSFVFIQARIQTPDFLFRLPSSIIVQTYEIIGFGNTVFPFVYCSKGEY